MRSKMNKKNNSHPKEKCGVVGVWTADAMASYFARRALAALQHRGQESAGMSVFSQGKIKTFKGMGLVPHVLTEEVLKKLGTGHTSIGHNRYATFGKSSTENAQPITVIHGKFQLSLAHNGNIPTVTNLKKHLGTGKKVMGDTELMTHMLSTERKKYASWEETMMHTLPLFHGAYCLTIITNDGSLFGARDPYGIRPLCLGKFKNGWIIASESPALDTIGAAFVRDIAPGEIIKITKGGVVSSSFFGEPKRRQSCLFECIYFARPDSFLNGRRVRAGREESGRLLAKRIKQKQLKPDVVVPTFDSGYPAAKGVARELGIPMVDAITTSHYVGRTFIQPGQSNRISAVNGKHNIVPDEIIGKNVVIIDDSAVRLTTSTALVKKFQEAGAKAIYLGFASPPVVNQCDLGIDMRAKNELPAAKFEKKPLEVIEQKMAEHVGADAFVYLPVEVTTKAFGGTPKDFYYTPFGGPHPIRGKQEVFKKMQKAVKRKIKIAVFISGNGTNLQKVIDTIEAGELDAEIVSVVANKSDAYGLERAKKHNIPAVPLPYEGKLKNQQDRKHYEEKLMREIETYEPDLVLLSGWMFVLSDSFTSFLQKKEIPLINHHWALLTQDAKNYVRTSRGQIPVFRGHHGFIETYNANVPVSGITVHQILPRAGFDEGPIVMKAEVRRKSEDTPESWEDRNRKMEYLLLLTALKRIVHVMQHRIDISKGTFPW